MGGEVDFSLGKELIIEIKRQLGGSKRTSFQRLIWSKLEIHRKNIQ